MVVSGRKCSSCNETDTLFYKGQFYWYKNKEGNWICRRCYLKTREFRTMKFKSKRIVFPFRIRTGFCIIKGCTETRTDRHHIDYITCFPLAMTVELCDMHHREENHTQEELQHEYNFDWNRTIHPLPLVII